MKAGVKDRAIEEAKTGATDANARAAGADLRTQERAQTRESIFGRWGGCLELWHGHDFFSNFRSPARPAPAKSNTTLSGYFSCLWAFSLPIASPAYAN